MNGFPFSAVVGMEELRLGLVLNAVSPGIETTVSRPDMRSASSEAIASPRPEPWASSAV